MMGRWRLLGSILGVSALSFLACGAEDPEPTTAGPPLEVATAELPIGSDALCMTNRWIGVKNASGNCPDPTGAGWKKEPLFGGGAPAALQKYCSYEWLGEATPITDRLPGKGKQLDPDCMIVGQSDYDDVSDIVRPVLADAQRRQLEAVPRWSLFAGAPIKVAVIDSWPNQTHPGRSFHGLGLAELIEGIACDSYTAFCPIWTEPFLALNRNGPKHVRNTVEGGTHGGIADAATAILAALPAPGAPPVVGVAAFGWDGRVNPSTVVAGELRYSMRALRDVLAHAACKDNFLLFAAAGNASGGPDPGSGPIYPAAFEPTMVTCPNGNQRPLIRSVAGLDGRDVPLGNRRPGATPMLAAPALAAPGRARVIGNQVVEVQPQTGSSVAAAVAATVAAMVWSEDVTMEGVEVVDAMVQGATELEEPALYCSQKPCGNALRLSMCDALAEVGASVTCTQVDAYTGENGVLDDDETSDVFDTVLDIRSGVDFTYLLDIPQCDGSLYTAPPASPPPPPRPPELVCPSELLYSDALLASTDPHEQVNTCPACHIFYNPGLVVTIDMVISENIDTTVPVVPARLNYMLGRVIVDSYDLVEADDTNGNRLGDGVQPGRSYRVELRAPGLEYGRDGDFDSVSIEWVRSDRFAASLLIVDEVNVRP